MQLYELIGIDGEHRRQITLRQALKREREITAEFTDVEIEEALDYALHERG